MELALTTDYAGWTETLDQAEDTLREIADYGISHVHWAQHWQGDHSYTPEEMKRISAMLKIYHLGAKGIHASAGWVYYQKEGMYKWPPLRNPRCDYASADEETRRRGADLIVNRLELADQVGTQEIVLHMQLPYVRFQTEPGF